MTRFFTERTDPAEPDAATLVAELDAHLCSLYAAEHRHLLPIDVLRQPHILFITARTSDGERIGCAALVNHHGEYGELKRMYVRPSFRGAGVAQLLLADLETRARILGLPVLRLETGIHQREALRFYEKSGYAYCAPFGEYTDNAVSRCMEKRLAPSPADGSGE